MQNYDAKTIPAPLGSCINEIYAKFWSRNIQQGITNDGLLHSGFQHQLVVLNHFVWWRSIGAFTFFSDRFYPQYQENGPHGYVYVVRCCCCYVVSQKDKRSKSKNQCLRLPRGSISPNLANKFGREVKYYNSQYWHHLWFKGCLWTYFASWFHICNWFGAYVKLWGAICILSISIVKVHALQWSILDGWINPITYEI